MSVGVTYQQELNTQPRWAVWPVLASRQLSQMGQFFNYMFRYFSCSTLFNFARGRVTHQSYVLYAIHRMNLPLNLIYSRSIFYSETKLYPFSTVKIKELQCPNFNGKFFFHNFLAVEFQKSALQSLFFCAGVRMYLPFAACTLSIHIS